MSSRLLEAWQQDLPAGRSIYPDPRLYGNPPMTEAECAAEDETRASKEDTDFLELLHFLVANGQISRKQAIEEMRHLKFRRGFEKGYDTGARNGTREGEKRGYKAGHRDGLEEGIEIGENRILDAVADYIPANVLEALRRKQKEYILVVYSRKRGWEEASQADDSDSDEEPQPQPAKKRARRYLTFSDDSTDESEAGEDNEEDSGKGQQSDESDEDEDTPAPAVQSEEQRRRDRTAIKPPSALEVRLDSENPLPAAPFQAPASNPSRRWTKAEILVIVYERRLGRFANRKPDGDFSWGRWISYRLTRWGFPARKVTSIEHFYSRLTKRGWLDQALEGEAYQLCHNGLDPTRDASRLVPKKSPQENQRAPGGPGLEWVAA